MSDQRYIATGTDVANDHGYWTVIVKAANRKEAIRKVETHLTNKNRQDLKIELCSKLNGIYSTVEGL